MAITVVTEILKIKMRPEPLIKIIKRIITRNNMILGDQEPREPECDYN